MCGERRREAFGTCVRVAGSFVSVAGPAVPLGATVLSRRLLAVNPDLSPLGGCRVGQEEGRAGRECKAYHPSASCYLGTLWKVFVSTTVLLSALAHRTLHPRAPLFTICRRNNRGYLKASFKLVSYLLDIICAYGVTPRGGQQR
jgi:hypothetical protein